MSAAQASNGSNGSNGGGVRAVLCAVRGATVRYGPTAALDAVDLDVRSGDVHALVGENGAGKSTLLRAIAGDLRLDGGSVQRPAGARLAWVPQETDLPLELTAAEWIYLGEELRGALGFLRTAEMRSGAARALAEIGCRVDPAARLGSLSIAERKQVQLARALREPPDILLLDEPTAVLGGTDAARLFAAVRRAREQGSAILYVSHRLEEVLAVADRVTVLRDGRRISTDPAGDVDIPTLVRRMVGRALPERTSRTRPRLQETALRLENVSSGSVEDFSLTVRCGEIVGLAGLVGAGRTEVLEAIAGLRGLRAGRIERAAAPQMVPEDRACKGLIPTLSVRENVFLPAAGWLLRPRREAQECREWIDKLSIRTRGTEDPIGALSGGNQQKVLLARALRHRPRLLLLDEPTAGVDIGAKADIHGIVLALADAGAAIVLASSELTELLHLCDRIVAMRGGRNVGVGPARYATEERLAALITGAVE